MEYTRYPVDTFGTLVINAGVLLTDFDPTDGAVAEAEILGATTGGINFSAKPSFIDFGEDIDNCPKNTKELKRIDDWDVKLSGTFIAAKQNMVRRLVGAAGLTGNKITPRDTLNTDASNGDFIDLWLVADYSSQNESGTGKSAGFIAIHMMNAFSTGGFQIKTADKEKGQFAFEFTGHYSKDAQDTVPFEIYLKAGTSSST